LTKVFPLSATNSKFEADIFKYFRQKMNSAFSNYSLEQTPKTPQIDLNQNSGELILSGKSIPENAARIYEPVLDWVRSYVLNAKPITNLRLNLEYFNTASMMWLSRILSVLKKIQDPEYILYVHLYMPVEEYDEMNDIEDIKDALIPVRDILQDATPCVGIKLYATNNSEVIKDALVFI